MLYQLHGKGTVNTSYLFGTMHLQNEDAFTYKEQILAKINECEAFATEFKLDDADEEKTTQIQPNYPSQLSPFAKDTLFVSK